MKEQIDEIKVFNDDEISVGKWFYGKPNLTPDKNGNISIITKLSFGPLEVFEWGIDSKGKPYRMYLWLENDFFKTDNYVKEITHSELKQQIESMIQLSVSNNLSEWIPIYEQAIGMLEDNS
ncbi:MAG: hypothetical protein J6B17_02000 [Ruminococcus sp.]|nr:hypothetical protein [Ruminococcus sp.]